MDILTALHTRRSVRSYAATPLTEDDIQTLLAAAMTAPSAANQQPWQFIVVTDKNLLQQCSTAHPYAAMAAKAPAGFLVCGDTNTAKYPEYWVQDCSAATQNILLAGVARGIGTVWTAVYPEQDRVDIFRNIFGLPEHIIPFALVVAGYWESTPKHMNRFEPAKVRRNHW